MKKHIVKNGRKIVGFVFYSNGALKYAFGKPSQNNYIAFDCASLDEGISKIKESGDIVTKLSKEVRQSAENSVMASMMQPERFNWAEHNANLQIYRDYFSDPDSDTNFGQYGTFCRQISCFITEEQHEQLVNLLKIAENNLLSEIKEKTNLLIRQNKAA